MVSINIEFVGYYDDKSGDYRKYLFNTGSGTRTIYVPRDGIEMFDDIGAFVDTLNTCCSLVIADLDLSAEDIKPL